MEDPNPRRVLFFKDEWGQYYFIVQGEPEQRINLDALQNLDVLLGTLVGYTKNQVNYLIKKNIGLAFQWESQWLIGTLYVEKELVTHNGSIWVALADNTGVEPGTNDLIWDLAVRGVPLEARIGIQLTASGAVSTGVGKAYLRVPIEFTGYSLTYVAISCETAPLTDKLTIQIYRERQASATDPRVAVAMLSTPVTIDIGELDSRFASVAVVIDTANDDLFDGDRLRFDITTSGGATGPVNVSMTAIKPIP